MSQTTSECIILFTRCSLEKYIHKLCLTHSVYPYNCIQHNGDGSINIYIHIYIYIYIYKFELHTQISKIKHSAHFLKYVWYLVLIIEVLLFFCK